MVTEWLQNRLFLALLQFKEMGKSIYDWSNVDAGNVIKPKPIEEPEKVVEPENNVVEKRSY